MGVFDKLKNYIQNTRSHKASDEDLLKEQTLILYDLIWCELKDFENEKIKVFDKDSSLKTQREKRIKEVEDKVLSLISENKDVLTLQIDESKDTIGLLATKLELYRITDLALENEVASTQVDKTGKNMGMLCAIARNTELTLKALDNPTASTQQDIEGYNIGHYCVRFETEDCILKAMDNETALLQYTNKYHDTMGMKAAMMGMEKATIKALKNPKASIQQDCFGFNILMDAAVCCLDEATCYGLENLEAVKQVNCNDYTISDYIYYNPEFLPKSYDKLIEIKESVGDLQPESKTVDNVPF